MYIEQRRKNSMKQRMNRIFRENGRTFILAMDHGTGLQVLPELADPGKILDAARTGGVDAVICTYGILSAYGSRFGKMSPIVRVDGGPTMLGPDGGCTRSLLDPEDALRAGADAMVCMGFPGSPHEEVSMMNLQKFVSEGARLNLPVCAEMLPMGWDSSNWNPERLTFVSRVGAEYGADFVKTQYTGDRDSFRELVAGCYVPVVILGGPGGNTERDLLQTVRDSLDAGGAGVAIGRSIWKHRNPAGYCKAISRIIHEDASVEDAIRELED